MSSNDQSATITSPWAHADLTAFGVRLPAAGASPAETGRALAASARSCAQGAAFLAWHQMQIALAVLELQETAAGDTLCDLRTRRVLDPHTQTAMRLAVVLAISQYQGEVLLADALGARDRLPACAACLRGGLISLAGFKKLLHRTDAVTDAAVLAVIDAVIAAEIRGTATFGAWTPARLGALADRTVMTHDPDGVRTREHDAQDRKGVWAENAAHGNGSLAIIASAEDILLAKNAVDALIDRVCEHDPRTKALRRSDAAIASLRGTAFTCECRRDDCVSPLGQYALGERETAIILHAICDSNTLAGGDKPGYLDGHGVISPAHARTIAARPDTRTRPLDLADLTTNTDPSTQTGDKRQRPGEKRQPSGKKQRRSGKERIPPRPDTPAPSRGDPSRPLIDRTALVGDPYRLTTTAETVIRFLHGTCTIPGCERPAWTCDLDHVTEYNHFQPSRGGPTCLCNVNPKCRFHHLIKTFAAGWTDDQHTDETGTIWTTITTPEGATTTAPARNHWLFPQLRNSQCAHTPVPADDPGHDPGRTRTRTENKHAYRRALRAAARRAREARKQHGTPHRRETGTHDPSDKPPF